MSNSQKITCSNIWKLFGPDEKRIMKDLDSSLSIKEVQEKTGHVVAVKNVSFSVEKGETFVVMGLSGSGKSTLINKLQPNLDIRTKEISAAHNQGKHTTTFSELYDLDFGGCIIDTPGIKGFGLVDMSRSEISLYFPEFIKLRSSCKFHNCLHNY